MLKPAEESTTGGPAQGRCYMCASVEGKFSADELACCGPLEGWMRTVATKSEGKRPRISS
jgi:hypothetical protein